ncbi:MAG: PTS fructose-like transporter subunit IIB [Vibrionaceae bacterium]
MKTVIVTACPSGIASTILAADLLKNAAQTLEWPVEIEMQSSLTQATPLSDAQIAAAELVILLGPVSNAQRFIGMPVFQAPIKACFDEPQLFLQRAAKECVILKKSALNAQPSATKSDNESVKVVGITACPTGVAHTFMAAEALTTLATKLGYSVKIETRGSVGVKNQLTEQEINEADFVIIAADIEIDLARFAGKRVYRTSTSAALKKTAQTLEFAASQAKVYHHAAATEKETKPSQTSITSDIYKHLMTGVSHMLPLVVAGGLCIALSFVFGIEAFKEAGTLPAALMKIGGDSAFALMISVFAGFIAFSIADRPGLAPGLIGGMLASLTGAGFLGGIVAGFLAGYSAKIIAEKLPLPESMNALKPIFLIPLIASLITGLVMVFVVGEPVSQIMQGLTSFLNEMGSANAVLLGALLGAMMCFDLGGPVNKAAYTFGVGLLASQTYAPMASIMAAGMVPALGIGVATILARKKFTSAERQGGRAAFILGLCFISEGAIPFAARDPLRMIPVCMAGGALTGALSMLFGAKLMAPHGGIFVMFIPNAIMPVMPYLAAIAAGTLLIGIVYAAIKPSAPAESDVK